MTPQVLVQKATGLLQKGDSARAQQLYEQIPPQARSALVWSNLGLAQQLNGKLDEALASFERALALAPNFVDAWYNGGVTLNHLGRNALAKAAYERVLALASTHEGARLNLGICQHALGNYEDARNQLGTVLRQNPELPLGWYWRGMALLELKQWTDAQECFEQTLRRWPQNSEAMVGLGNAYLNRDLFEQALSMLDQAQALIGSQRFDIAYYRGNALRGLGRYLEAIEAYRTALSFKPNSIESLANLGVCYEQCHDFATALQCYDALLAVEPDNPVGLFNSANALGDLGRLHEAIERYNMLEATGRSLPGRELNLSICLLKLGDYEHGLPLYESRLETPHPADTYHFEQPMWLGDAPLTGKRILLHTEQGIGDTLQFCRYVRQVKALGAYVILRAQDALVPLLSSLQHVDELVGKKQALPAFDTHCPLLSLPLAFKTRLDNVEATVPYLWADAARVQKWQNVLAPRSKPVVGLSWQGAKAYRFDFRRSMPLSALEPLFSCADKVDFVVLQKDLSPDDLAILARYPQVRVLPEQVDFSDAAALVAAIDLVISVDTAIAHLGGALGKPTWILLPSVADWRWVVNQTRTPWYPYTHLFWQSEVGKWSGPVQAISQALQTFSPIPSSSR